MNDQTPISESDGPGSCGCPTLSNGDARCHVCGEYVNKRCWNCRTPRGGGVCPNPRATSPVGDSAPCPRCGGPLVPYWFTYGGPMEVCEDPGCAGWRYVTSSPGEPD